MPRQCDKENVVHRLLQFSALILTNSNPSQIRGLNINLLIEFDFPRKVKTCRGGSLANAFKAGI